MIIENNEIGYLHGWKHPSGPWRCGREEWGTHIFAWQRRGKICWRILIHAGRCRETRPAGPKPRSGRGWRDSPDRKPNRISRRSNSGQRKP